MSDLILNNTVVSRHLLAQKAASISQLLVVGVAMTLRCSTWNVKEEVCAFWVPPSHRSLPASFPLQTDLSMGSRWQSRKGRKGPGTWKNTEPPPGSRSAYMQLLCVCEKQRLYKPLLCWFSVLVVKSVV